MLSRALRENVALEVMPVATGGAPEDYLCGGTGGEEVNDSIDIIIMIKADGLSYHGCWSIMKSLPTSPCR